MSPFCLILAWPSVSLPRTRGDEPLADVRRQAAEMSAPHPRG